MRKRKIYVASSWRNLYQQRTVKQLREAGHEVYDFKNPIEGGNVFHWREISAVWSCWNAEGFRNALDHPIAVAGFKSDFEAMEWADICVLLLPCGKSAHLEAGHFCGADKDLIILLDSEEVEPELMYKMADYVCINIDEVKALLA